MCVQHPRKEMEKGEPIKLTADLFLSLFSMFLGIHSSNKGCPDCGSLYSLRIICSFSNLFGSVLPAQGHKKLRKTCTTPERSGETSHILSRWNLLGLVRRPEIPIPDTLGIEPESRTTKRN